jgi:phage-related baseplate assembly protein
MSPARPRARLATEKLEAAGKLQSGLFTMSSNSGLIRDVSIGAPLEIKGLF